MSNIHIYCYLLTQWERTHQTKLHGKLCMFWLVAGNHAWAYDVISCQELSDNSQTLAINARFHNRKMTVFFPTDCIILVTVTQCQSTISVKSYSLLCSRCNKEHWSDDVSMLLCKNNTYARMITDITYCSS